MRIAVVSPFVDKAHGTERHIAELLPRLAEDFEVHVYSQDVKDVDLAKITWRRIPRIPGPHLVNYLWWFTANHLYRWRDRRFKGLRTDLVFSPGINCLDADHISVHILFINLYQQARPSLRFRRNRVRFWPRLLHRLLYYNLIMALERRIYPKATLISTISRKTADDLKRLYNRDGEVPVVYAGIDDEIFNPEARSSLRAGARKALGLADSTFALLLIGNGWENKGLSTLIEACRRLAKPDIHLLVVGQDDPRPFQQRIQERGLAGSIQFLPPRPDVMAYYAAADAYVGPSLEDAFAQPPAEAMACGLPVLASAQAGVSEIITDGVDGLVLKDPQDSAELASLIDMLYRNGDFRQRLGEAAAKLTREYTWDHNAEQISRLIRSTIDSRKSKIVCAERQSAVLEN